MTHRVIAKRLIDAVDRAVVARSRLRSWSLHCFDAGLLARRCKEGTCDDCDADRELLEDLEDATDDVEQILDELLGGCGG